MKRVVYIISGICVLLVAICFFGMQYVNSGLLADRISTMLKDSDAGNITFEQQPRLSLMPLRLSMGKTLYTFTTNAANIKISLHSGHMDFSPWDLIEGKISIREVMLDTADVTVDMAGSSGNAEAGSVKKALWLPEVQKMLIQHGTFNFSNDSMQANLADINLSADNLRPRQEADIKCDFTMSLMEKTAERNARCQDTAWNMAFRTRVRYYAPNLIFNQAAVTFTPATPNLPASVFPARATFEGAINFDTGSISMGSGEVIFPIGRLSLAHETTFQLPSFRGQCNLELNTLANNGHDETAQESAPPVIISADTFYGNRQLKLSDMAINTGGSTGSGQLVMLFPQNAPINISGELRLGTLDAKTVLAFVAGMPHTETGESGTPFGYPQVDIALGASRLTLEKFHVDRLNAYLHGAMGDYKVDNMACAWAGGTMHGSIAANLAKAHGNFDLAAEGIILGTALDQFNVPGIEGGQTDFKASLSVKGLDITTLLASLEGTGSLQARNAKIRILEDIFQYLPVLAKKTDLPDGIGLLKADFTASQGTVNFNPVIIDARGVSGEGSAKLNLANDRIDGSARIKALGFDLPFTFSGPLSDVSFGIAPDFFPGAGRDRH